MPPAAAAAVAKGSKQREPLRLGRRVRRRRRSRSGGGHDDVGADLHVWGRCGRRQPAREQWSGEWVVFFASEKRACVVLETLFCSRLQNQQHRHHAVIGRPYRSTHTTTHLPYAPAHSASCCVVGVAVRVLVVGCHRCSGHSGLASPASATPLRLALAAATPTDADSLRARHRVGLESLLRIAAATRSPLRRLEVGGAAALHSPTRLRREFKHIAF